MGKVEPSVTFWGDVDFDDTALGTEITIDVDWERKVEQIPPAATDDGDTVGLW